MTNLLKAISISLILSLSGLAWGNSTPEERATKSTEKMMEKLELDASIREQLHDINLRYATEADPVLKSSDGKFKKGRKLRKIFKRKDEELKDLFTKEQYEEYKKLREELMQELKAARKEKNN